MGKKQRRSTVPESAMTGFAGLGPILIALEHEDR